MCRKTLVVRNRKPNSGQMLPMHWAHQEEIFRHITEGAFISDSAPTQFLTCVSKPREHLILRRQKRPSLSHLDSKWFCAWVGFPDFMLKQEVLKAKQTKSPSASFTSCFRYREGVAYWLQVKVWWKYSAVIDEMKLLKNLI